MHSDTYSYAFVCGGRLHTPTTPPPPPPPLPRNHVCQTNVVCQPPHPPFGRSVSRRTVSHSAWRGDSPFVCKAPACKELPPGEPLLFPPPVLANGPKRIQPSNSDRIVIVHPHHTPQCLVYVRSATLRICTSQALPSPHPRPRQQPRTQRRRQPSATDVRRASRAQGQKRKMGAAMASQHRIAATLHVPPTQGQGQTITIG